MDQYELDSCRARVHWRCPGSERDRGDGTWVRCACACHEPGPDAAYDRREEQEDAAW